MARRRRRYKVKAGDNYFTIAENLFGDQRFAGYLIRANPGINVLHPGIVLKVPKIDPETTEPIIGQAAWERVMEADEEKQASSVDEKLMAIDEMEAFEEGPQEPFSVDELAAEQEMWLNNPKTVQRWAEMFAEAAREAGLVPEVVEPVSEVEETADVPSISDMAWEAEQTDAGGLDVAGDNVFGTQASQLEAAREAAGERPGEVGKGGKVSLSLALQGETPTPMPEPGETELTVDDAQRMLLDWLDVKIEEWEASTDKSQADLDRIEKTFLKMRNQLRSGVLTPEAVAAFVQGEIGYEPPEPESTSTPTTPPEPSYFIYVVPEGESLSLVSTITGVSIEVIMEENGIVDANVVFANQVLFIPVEDATIPDVTTLIYDEESRQLLEIALAEITNEYLPKGDDGEYKADDIQILLSNMDIILEEAAKYGLDTNEAAYIFATALWESKLGGLMYELGLNSEFTARYYDDLDIRKELGNEHVDDGWWFKGRGFVQITGRNVYTYYSDILEDVDLIDDPDIVSRDPEIAAQIMVHGMVNGVFKGLDKDNGDIIVREVSGAAIDNYDFSNEEDIIAARNIVTTDENGVAIKDIAVQFACVLSNMCGLGLLQEGIQCAQFDCE